MGASHLVSLNHLCKFSGGQIVTESLPCNGFSKKPVAQLLQDLLYWTACNCKWLDSSEQ